MKVQITVDLSDDELIGIGLISNGQFVKASRADAATWLQNTLAPELVRVRFYPARGLVAALKIESDDRDADLKMPGVPTEREATPFA